MIEEAVEQKEEPTRPKYYVYMLARPTGEFVNGVYEPRILTGGKALPYGGSAVYEAYPVFRSQADARGFMKAISDEKWDVMKIEVAQ